MSETTTTTGPRIWVGCLACYNAGALLGEWVDLTGDKDLDAMSVDEVIDRHEPDDDPNDVQLEWIPSWTDKAYDFVDEVGYLSEMPEPLRGYFDYEKFGRDLRMDYVAYGSDWYGYA